MNFCTIITADYASYPDSLAASLDELGCEFRLFTLVTGSDVPRFRSQKIVSLQVDDVPDPMTDALKEKYFDVGRADEFRWSMKSVLMLHLLEDIGLERVIFVDPDVAFFSDPSFLFDGLTRARVLLTPHWRCPDPGRDPWNFADLQTNGLFNAGFIGVSRGSEPALRWWSGVCLYRCDKRPEEGLFDDQAYLDLMPVYFEGVEILRHRGCNVANWNLSENRRVIADDGSVRVGGDPLVFIHFTQSTIRGILNGEDEKLRAHLDRWIGWAPKGDFRHLLERPEPLPATRPGIASRLLRRAVRTV